MALIWPAGCASSPELYPLEVGNKWSYRVQDAFGESVQVLEVTREVPVGPWQGVELRGDVGLSWLGWHDGILYAARVPNATFDPPLPLVSSRNPRAASSWKGEVTWFGQTSPAEATLRQQPAEETVGSRKFKATRVVVTLRAGDREIELVAWYHEGTGLIRQVQRTSGSGTDATDFDVALEYVSGP